MENARSIGHLGEGSNKNIGELGTFGGQACIQHVYCDFQHPSSPGFGFGFIAENPLRSTLPNLDGC